MGEVALGDKYRREKEWGKETEEGLDGYRIASLRQSELVVQVKLAADNK